jgi:hypothetical protein
MKSYTHVMTVKPAMVLDCRTQRTGSILHNDVKSSFYNLMCSEADRRLLLV